MSEGHEVVAHDVEVPEVPEVAPEPVVEKVEDELEEIVPDKSHRTWTFGRGDVTISYVQRPLSFQGKLEFMGLLGTTVNQAMSGPDGLTVSGMLAEMDPDQRSRLSAFSLAESDFASADTFIQGISVVLSYAPDFLVKAQCIWLNVPRGERQLVADLMSAPPDEGGLSDEQAIDMIQTFLDQNMQDLVTFFRRDLPKLGKRGKNFFQLGVSASSKR